MLDGFNPGPDDLGFSLRLFESAMQFIVYPVEVLGLVLPPIGELLLKIYDVDVNSLINYFIKEFATFLRTLAGDAVKVLGNQD
jgi:hypothetical protein